MQEKNTITVHCFVIVVNSVTNMNDGIGLIGLLLPEQKTRHLRESLFQQLLEESWNVGK